MPAEGMHGSIDKIMLLREIFFQQLKSNNNEHKKNIANKTSNLKRGNRSERNTNMYRRHNTAHIPISQEVLFGRNYNLDIQDRNIKQRKWIIFATHWVVVSLDT